MVRVLDVHRWFKDGVVSPLLCGVATKETVQHASTQLTRVYIGIGNILLGVTLRYPIQRGGGGGGSTSRNTPSWFGRAILVRVRFDLYRITPDI